MAFAVSAVVLFGAQPASAKTTSVAKTAVTRTTKGVRSVHSKPSTGGKRTGTTRTKAQPAVVVLPSEAPADTANAALVERAKQLVGSRYVRGGTNPRTGFDCSGFVHYLLGDKAKSLPRTTGGMYQSIAKTSELHPGDVVFFGRGSVRHVGIYAGNGQVVHASTPRTGVRVDSLPVLARALGYLGSGDVAS